VVQRPYRRVDDWSGKNQETSEEKKRLAIPREEGKIEALRRLSEAWGKRGEVPTQYGQTIGEVKGE